MGFFSSSGETFRKYFVLPLLFFVLTLPGKSQNLFLSDSSGILLFGQFSQIQHFEGPAIGLSYSFNGKTAIGMNYGASSIDKRNYRNLSISANHLVKNQTEGDPFNVEVIPAFERKYLNFSEQNLSLFSFAAGISRDFSQKGSINLIPRISLSYLVSPSVGVTNFLSTGFDMNMGFDLSKHVKLIASPEINLRLDSRRLNGILMSGLVVH